MRFRYFLFFCCLLYKLFVVCCFFVCFLFLFLFYFEPRKIESTLRKKRGDEEERREKSRIRGTAMSTQMNRSGIDAHRIWDIIFIFCFTPFWDDTGQTYQNQRFVIT